ncbi:hypothetical protein O3P69_000260 [Scylla paramamosain]|uniref:Uncharacterized protein n=1 Tax=Scylla paramamosain TaxID=85552 RepID=A0AAW0UZQ9_SCYPA
MNKEGMVPTSSQARKEIHLSSSKEGNWQHYKRATTTTTTAAAATDTTERTAPKRCDLEKMNDSGKKKMDCLRTPGLAAAEDHHISEEYTLNSTKYTKFPGQYSCTSFRCGASPKKNDAEV